MRWKAQCAGLAVVASLEECACVNLLTGDIDVARPAQASVPMGFWYDDVRYDVEEIQDFSTRRPHVRTLMDPAFLIKHAKLRAACRRDILAHALDKDSPAMVPERVRF